jgi:hypothetical protein
MGRLAWLRVTIIMLIANFNFADLVSTRALRSDSGFEVTPSRPKQDPRKICRVVPRSPRETRTLWAGLVHTLSSPGLVRAGLEQHKSGLTNKQRDSAQLPESGANTQNLTK